MVEVILIRDKGGPHKQKQQIGAIVPGSHRAKPLLLCPIPRPPIEKQRKTSLRTLTYLEKKLCCCCLKNNLSSTPCCCLQGTCWVVKLGGPEPNRLLKA